MELERAKLLVNELLEALRPGCSRIEIAGGIRRGKPDVHDLELVAVPIPRTRIVFGQKQTFKTELDALLYDLCAQDPTRRDVLTFSPRNRGEKYKKFEVTGSAQVFNPNINLDLFIVTPPAQWGVIYTIRTGSADFSHWLVTKRSKGGALPDHLQVKDGTVFDFVTGEIPDVPEEIDFLNLLELGWIEPSRREPQWGRFNLRSNTSAASSEGAVPAAPKVDVPASIPLSSKDSNVGKLGAAPSDEHSLPAVNYADIEGLFKNFPKPVVIPSKQVRP